MLANPAAAIQPWVYVAYTDVQASILAEALTLANNRATQRGLAAPFTLIMPGVVTRVRNKVASALQNQVSSDPLKIPPELLRQTALLIGYEIVLPLSAGNKDVISEDIRNAIKRAEGDLRDAAEGKLAISLPDDPLLTTAVSSRGPIQTVGERHREATRESLRGL